MILRLDGYDNYLMVKTTKSSFLDIIFQERIVVYVIVPFVISFSFFGIVIESTRILSMYNSPYFYWYPIYFVFIIPFSIYTNSSLFVGSRFLRSVFETVFEVFLLLLFNFIFLKGFSFGRNIGEFLDIDFGISFVFWVAIRITNGHIVRVINFPYELISAYANAIVSDTKIDEVFDEKYFERRSVKNSFRSLVFTFSFMLIIISISVLLSSSILTLFYTVLFVLCVLILLLNISKVYVLEESYVKKLSIENVSFLNNLVKFTFVYSFLVVFVSVVFSGVLYFGAREVSSRLNIAIKDKVSEILSQERKIDEEEIKKIRERLMSESVTNEYVVPKIERREGKGIGWGLILVFVQYVLFVVLLIVFVGFILKEVFKARDVPILGFFVRFYEIFVYLVSILFKWVFGVLGRLFSRGRRVWIPQNIEDELIASMQIEREKLSKEKVEEIETIVKIFINMLLYTVYILPYKRSMGIEEYCDALKGFLPEFSKHLEYISNVVNESRYSNHLLPSETIDELKSKVNDIISKIKLKVNFVEEFRGG
ncbi:MAG: hypothetical protein ACK4F9_02545 [Brevinematia bacterium]